MSSSQLAAECRELVQVYPSANGPVQALRGVTATFPRASLTVIVGPSGAGKSTLLRLLGCLEPPTVGEVFVDGRHTAHLGRSDRRRLVGRSVGHVFQMPADNLLDYLSVRDQVCLAWRMRTKEQPGQVDELLETMALQNVARVRPNELGVGEQQQLAFAMAVAGDPALVVADEPTANLDPDGAALLVSLFADLIARGQTLVIATHDERVIQLADEVLVIRQGVLVAAGPPQPQLPSVIDAAGRIVIGPEALDLFPDQRARVVRSGDELRITPP